MRIIVMRINETIKNIRASCDNYVDKDLVATIIHDNYYMGTNNILEFNEYGIEKDDSYEKRILKILKHENIFLAAGMYTFIPVINECDISDLCGCSIDASFKEIEKSDLDFYKKIEEIIDSLVIY